MGIASSMWHDASFVKGVGRVNNFDRYPILKLQQMPQVQVQIVSSEASPGGIGEVGVPCVAPSLANAYAALTGSRLRDLPFHPGVVLHDS